MPDGSGISIRFNWKSAISAGAGILAEAAMLTLVADASLTFKLATLACAVAVFLVLQFEALLYRYGRNLFWGLLGTLLIIYLGFIIYAVSHAIAREKIRGGLIDILAASTELAERELSEESPDQHGVVSGKVEAHALAQFTADYTKWENESAKWIKDHLGMAARTRFLDRGGMNPMVGWGRTMDTRYDQLMNRLEIERKNLSVIIETGAYEK
jgi:hypothetical protein